jgi:glycosyltransferase involved in cell wall biosynthesis
MKPRLLFIYQYFYPELAGSAQQLTDLAAGLVERGYAVAALTAQPTYTGKKRLPQTDRHRGIAIHRLSTLQLPRHAPLGRILESLSFFIQALWHVLRYHQLSHVVIVANPPFMPLIGWISRKLRGQRYIVLIHDLYPDIAVALGVLKPHGLMTRMLKFSNKLSFADAEALVVLSDAMARPLARYKPKKTDVIHSWANGSRIRPLEKALNPFRRDQGLGEKLVVLFSGNLGRIYDFKDLLRAAEMTSKTRAITFLFIGDGPQGNEMRAEVETRKLENVRLMPYQPEEDLPYSLTCADLAVIPVKREAADFCLPSKLYYALAGGVPILAIAPEHSELARIVQDHDCGWAVDPGKPDEVAALLRALASDPSPLARKARNARACFEAHYTRERALTQYESLFASAFSADGAPACKT